MLFVYNYEFWKYSNTTTVSNFKVIQMLDYSNEILFYKYVLYKITFKTSLYKIFLSK